MSIVLQTVVPIFAIIFVGFVVGRYRKVNIHLVTDFLLYLTLPCLAFYSIVDSGLDLKECLAVAGPGAVVMLLIGFLVLLFLAVVKSKKTELYLPLAFSNSTFLGAPVIAVAFGLKGLSMALIYGMTSAAITFTLGVYILHKKHEVMEIFRLPFIYAVIIALVVSQFHIMIPSYVMLPFELIGKITIPLALLFLGYQLNDTKLTSIKIAVFASLFKIAGSFFIAYLIIKLLSVSGLAAQVVILQASMPSAVLSTVLAEKYKRDTSLVASIVLITTLLGVVSIPFTISIVKTF